MSKFADVLSNWLSEAGYTHCFFVAGGNSMHLLDGARKSMKCVPFVHEVAAVIAAEYFNEVSEENKAYVLVTAGPGLTNAITGIAGAFLESRGVLVVGGQVKSTDLSTYGLRQRGIQEIDGEKIAMPITKVSKRYLSPFSRDEFDWVLSNLSDGRPGPCFMEICLDAQAAPYVDQEPAVPKKTSDAGRSQVGEQNLDVIYGCLQQSQRPVLLIGGGIPRSAKDLISQVAKSLGMPVMTTWNAADRVSSNFDLYFGRPNTWGQRYSNLILQQSDMLIALGTRLGLQQTGFNWQEFAKNARVVQVDLDQLELDKGHPKVDIPLCVDGVQVLKYLSTLSYSTPSEWLSFCNLLKSELPLSERENSSHPPFLNPYDFVLRLSEICRPDDIVIPCSSGGAFTVMMQAFNQQHDQIMVTNKGLASMGYGLSGAVGASLADTRRRTILVEGDGGFAQNVQELATVRVNNLPIKMFIFANNGYASIRMTQRNYFDGAYLGCDVETGLGFPDWQQLATAFGIESTVVTDSFTDESEFVSNWNSAEPHLFVVPIHPDQTYFPKISSRITPSGGMESAPLHEMTPTLSVDQMHRLGKFLV